MFKGKTEKSMMQFIEMEGKNKVSRIENTKDRRTKGDRLKIHLAFSCRI